MQRRTLSYQATLLFLVLADLLCVLGAYVGAFLLRIYFPFPFTANLLPSARLGEVNHPLVFLLATQVVLLYFFGFYDLQTLKRRIRLVTNVAAALGVQLLATTAWYFFRGDLFFPRSVLMLFWFLNTAGVAGLRLWMVYHLGRVQPSRVLLVGTVEDVRAFLAGLPELLHFPELKVAGLVSLNEDRDQSVSHSVSESISHSVNQSISPSDSQTPRLQTERLRDCETERLRDWRTVSSSDSSVSSAVPWLGSADDLPRIVQEIEVDDMILLSPATWKDSFVDRLLRLPAGWQGHRPRVLVVPSVYDILVGRVSSLRLHDVPLVEVLKDSREDMAFLVKGVLDVGIAGLLLMVSLPILFLAAVLVKLTSSGPILYQQRRVGKGGKEFIVYKLRTMVDDAEEKTGPVLASREDERITWVGRFLRTSRIDEIPQLFNVLSGTMSLVGPRPERPEFAEEFLCKVPGYAERLQVKPGLTGLAQVNGEYHTTPEYKLKYDLAYIYNYSLWLDLRILAETVKVMLTRRGV